MNAECGQKAPSVSAYVFNVEHKRAFRLIQTDPFRAKVLTELQVHFGQRSISLPVNQTSKQAKNTELDVL